MAAADAEQLSSMLKALGHPNRLRLFQEIRRAGRHQVAGSGCLLGDAIRALRVGAPTISHHLKELVQAGLVATERQGKFVVCRVEPDALARLARFFT
jgi:ArsR family transcriptional regulator